MLYPIIFVVFSLINQAFSGVLILSSKETELSSLKAFDENSFNHLKDAFKNFKIISYKVNSEKIPNCENLLQSKHTVYIPTSIYLPENVNVLEQNCDEIKKQIHISDLDRQKNVIYLIFHDSIRIKRDAEFTSTEASSSASPSTTIESFTSTKSNPEKNFYKERTNFSPDDPVVYYAPATQVYGALIYSSRAPVLRVQGDSDYELGGAAVVTVDKREGYYRLICNIPVENGKVSLRFRFSEVRKYWYLTSVSAEDANLKSFNLTVTQEVMAPMNFSYGCGGETIFTDSTGSASLILYDMQVQFNVNGRRFSDAYNCVPFMTGPIWSGIFVTAILGIGLIIGLGALSSIKTMDKFDNSKTKQLTITIMGE